LQAEKEHLLQETSALKKQHESDIEFTVWTEQRQAQMKDAFSSLSSAVLKNNSEQYLNSAKEIFEGLLTRVRGDWGTHKVELQKMVEPLEKTLSTLDQYTKDLETKREGAYSGLQEQLRQLADAHGKLQTSTDTLVQALRSPGVRGKWGEEQLRRIVELVGMINFVDFAEQVSTEEGRPDMIVHLPNKGILPVDAKTPMTAYLDAMNAPDELTRRAKMIEHAGVMRQRIRDLGAKSYWKQFEHTPEVVIMFIPNDGCIGAAFEQSPDLFEYAVQNNVIITSPFTLYALLKAISFGWQQHQVAENSKFIAEQSKLLYDRLNTFLNHFGNIGSGLAKAVNSFNASIGSFNSRLLPVAQKLSELGASTKELEKPEALDVHPKITDETELES
jgi:DNA recombination protein RmuC